MFKINFNNFNSIFEFQFMIFRIVGIRFDLSEPKKNSWRDKLANTIYCVLGYTLYFIEFVFSILYLIFNEASLEKILEAIPNLINHIAAFTKFFTIYRNLEKVEIMLNSLKKLYNLKQVNQMVDQKKFIRNATSILNIVKVFLLLAPISMVVPGVMTYFKYWSNGKWDPLFTADVWCPFEVNDHYFSLYMYIYYTAVITTINMGACDCLCCMILVHITQQLKELSRDFNELDGHGRKLVNLVDRQILLYKYQITIKGKVVNLKLCIYFQYDVGFQ